MEDIESCEDKGEDEKVYMMIDAMIRFFFKENPELLNDDQYAQRFSEIKWLAKQGFF